MENNNELKWHQKPKNIIIALILFLPVGIYFMWKNKIWSKKTRWIVSGIFLIAIAAQDSTGSGSFGKPSICECHDAWMEDITQAMYGDATTSSKTDRCSIYYTTDEMTYADERNGC